MDEIIIDTGVPLEVDTGGSTYVVYNSMFGDDALMVSSHGDVNKRWLKVEQGNYVKFATPLWFMQDSNGQVALPCYEVI